MRHRWMKAIGIGTVMGLMGSACSAEEAGLNDGGGDQGEEVSSLTMVHPGETVLGFSPLTQTDAVSLGIMTYFYEGLVSRDPETNAIIPELAESWETPDEETWIFDLREDVKFHDGTDFTAESVVYVYDKVENDPESVRTSLFDSIEDVNAIDDHTLEITTDGPFGTLLDVVARSNLYIYSPSADENGDIGSEPVGTGPFELEQWNEGDSFEASAFPDYWREKPVVDSLVVREISDSNTALSLLETGEADIVTNVPHEQADRVEGMNGVTMEQTEGTAVNYLALNTEKEPMSDIDFRRAVSMAVDRDAYIEHIGGFGKRTDSYAGTKTFAYDEAADDQGIEYDPEGAQEILEENGWDGTELELMSTNADETRDRAVFLQNSLEQVGLDIELEMLDSATFLERYTGEDIELALGSWTSGGNSMLFDNFHSSNIDVSNVARFSDSEVDELLEQSNVTLDDQERERILQEANLVAMEKAPWVVLNHSIINSGIREEAVDSVTFTSTPTNVYIRRNND